MRATVYFENRRIMSTYFSGSSHSLLKRTSVFSRIEDLEDLRLVGFGVLVDGLARHGRARHVAAGGVADHAGHIADQEDDGVAQVLEVLHLAQQDGVAQVQVGRGGVEAGFDAQRPAFWRPRSAARADPLRG